ncbi:MAG TPA: hypothetical protein VK997_12555, partial [Deferrisomatales bacterium]|nr:hypothetical protein [Deferrisomatales bacterium]
LNLLGCTRGEMAGVLGGMGYVPELDEAAGSLRVARRKAPRARRGPPSPARPGRHLRPDSGSPFAGLARLKRKG